MSIFAIDPGTRESAWVLYDPVHAEPIAFGKDANAVLLDRIGATNLTSTVVIEKVESYGMAVGVEVFETVRWAGRFEQRAQPRLVVRLPRREVKLHLCGQARAKDPNVRQALIDRWGGKEQAIGRKKAPGPLYGVTGDVWAALAVAITYVDTADRPDPRWQDIVDALSERDPDEADPYAETRRLNRMFNPGVDMSDPDEADHAHPSDTFCEDCQPVEHIT